MPVLALRTSTRGDASCAGCTDHCVQPSDAQKIALLRAGGNAVCNSACWLARGRARRRAQTVPESARCLATLQVHGWERRKCFPSLELTKPGKRRRAKERGEGVGGGFGAGACGGARWRCAGTYIHDACSTYIGYSTV